MVQGPPETLERYESLRLEDMLDTDLTALSALDTAMDQRQDWQRAETAGRVMFARWKEEREHQERLTIARNKHIIDPAKPFLDTCPMLGDVVMS